MKYKDTKKWLEEKGYKNNGLRVNLNHKPDSYLSDILLEFFQEIQADIRNKLSSPHNLVSILESREIYKLFDKDMGELIKREISQTKKAIEYLTDKE